MSEFIFENLPIVMADLLRDNYRPKGCVIGRNKRVLDQYFSKREGCKFGPYEIVDISLERYKEIFEKFDFMVLDTVIRSEETNMFLNSKKYSYRVKSVNDIKFTISHVSEEKAWSKALAHVRDNLTYFINLERVG